MKRALPKRHEQIDLNLFRVFEAVMRHRSVSAAGRELGVTASAVSHAVARLRTLFGDDLFLSSDEGMVPTPRALELAPDVRTGLAGIARALEARAFDPAGMLRIFGIAASEYPAAIVLPGLLQRMLKQAPNASLRVSPLGRLDIVRQLDAGHIDLVIGWFDTLPDRMRRQILFREEEAMVVRAGHPLTQQTLTQQKLLAYPHIVVEFTGSEDPQQKGFIDDRGVVRRVWIERLLVKSSARGSSSTGRIAATVPTYAVIGPVLAETDLVATLPRRLALAAVQRDGLAMLELPYSPLSVGVEMVWHERTEGDPAMRWLREQIASTTPEFVVEHATESYSGGA